MRTPRDAHYQRVPHGAQLARNRGARRIGKTSRIAPQCLTRASSRKTWRLCNRGIPMQQA